MARRKRIEEPVPKHQTVVVKSGWCTGLEEVKNHRGCYGERFSEYTNKTYQCSCDCHKEKKKK